MKGGSLVVILKFVATSILGLFMPLANLLFVCYNFAATK
jgi:hypothetical protein